MLFHIHCWLEMTWDDSRWMDGWMDEYWLDMNKWIKEKRKDCLFLILFVDTRSHDMGPEALYPKPFRFWFSIIFSFFHFQKWPLGHSSSELHPRSQETRVLYKSEYYIKVSPILTFLSLSFRYSLFSPLLGSWNKILFLFHQLYSMDAEWNGYWIKWMGIKHRWMDAWHGWTLIFYGWLLNMNRHWYYMDGY